MSRPPLSALVFRAVLHSLAVWPQVSRASDRQTAWTALDHLDVNLSLTVTSQSVTGCAVKCMGISAVTQCPVDLGYDLYKGQCMKEYTTPKGFAKASSSCFDDNAHLNHAKTTYTLAVLVEYLARSGTASAGYYWVGADDRAVEDDFHWSDGSSLPEGDPVWYTGEPNNQGGEDCVALRFSKSRLQDDDCPNRMAYICQVDIF